MWLVSLSPNQQQQQIHGGKNAKENTHFFTIIHSFKVQLSLEAVKILRRRFHTPTDDATRPNHLRTNPQRLIRPPLTENPSNLSSSKIYSFFFHTQLGNLIGVFLLLSFCFTLFSPTTLTDRRRRRLLVTPTHRSRSAVRPSATTTKPILSALRHSLFAI